MLTFTFKQPVDVSKFGGHFSNKIVTVQNRDECFKSLREFNFDFVCLSYRTFPPPLAHNWLSYILFTLAYPHSNLPSNLSSSVFLKNFTLTR